MRSAPLAEATPELPLTEGGKLKIGCAIAANRVGAESGTLERPRAPHIICVDRDAIRDGVLVIDLPEGVPQRFQHEPFRCLASYRFYLRDEEVFSDYPFRRNSRERPAFNAIAECRLPAAGGKLIAD